MSGKVGALIAGACLTAVVVWVPLSRAITKPGSIRITGDQIKRTNVDVGPRGASAGDMEITRQLLYNRRITTKSIGHAEVVCISTGNGSRSCSGTYFLPKGKLMVGGLIASRLLYEVGVLGGTGLYANARGTLTVTSLDRDPVRDLIVFRLTP